MRKYTSYIVSPAFYMLIAIAGRMFTAQRIDPWYQSISKPSYTPPGSFIGIMWTIIYILTAVSLILFINKGRGKPLFQLIIVLYVLNGIVNAAWSYLFFTKHLIGLAVIDAVLIGATVLLIMVMVWRYSSVAALLLMPYLGWVSFAAYLNYVIYRINS